MTATEPAAGKRLEKPSEVITANSLVYLPMTDSSFMVSEEGSKTEATTGACRSKQQL